jgi:hypothetical protein
MCPSATKNRPANGTSIINWGHSPYYFNTIGADYNRTPNWRVLKTSNDIGYWIMADDHGTTNVTNGLNHPAGQNVLFLGGHIKWVPDNTTAPGGATTNVNVPVTITTFTDYSIRSK